MLGHFHSIHGFYHMGGYASFVWPAYLAFFAAFTYLFLRSRFKLARQLKKLRRKREP